MLQSKSLSGYGLVTVGVCGGAPLFTARNTLTYGFCDFIAGVLQGAAASPMRVGFVYGTLADPGLPYVISRDAEWSVIGPELLAAGANVQLRALSRAPAAGEPDTGFENNTVLYSAHTGASGAEYVYRQADGYAAPFADGMYLYQAMLIAPGANRRVVARISLYGQAGYAVKPAGFELGVEWRVAFN